MVSIKLPKPVASNEYTVSIAAEIGEAIEFTSMNAAHNFKIIHLKLLTTRNLRFRTLSITSLYLKHVRHNKIEKLGTANELVELLKNKNRKERNYCASPFFYKL